MPWTRKFVDTRKEHHCPKCGVITKVEYEMYHRCAKCGYIPDLDKYVP